MKLPHGSMTNLSREFPIAGLAAALTLPLLLLALARADDWPQWRGLNRDGVWREGGILEAIPPKGLKVRWRARIGPGYSGPAVAQGRVLVTDRQLPRLQHHAGPAGRQVERLAEGQHPLELGGDLDRVNRRLPLVAPGLACLAHLAPPGWGEYPTPARGRLGHGRKAAVRVG